MASVYRSQIADLLSRLANNTASAREWRTVADNRLALLVVLDSAIAAVYSAMLVSEKETSVRAPSTDVPLADANVHSADEVCRFSLERLKCCAMYLGSLRNETSSIQSLLLDTLNDGLQLLSVQRPSCDLQMAHYPEMGEDEEHGPHQDLSDPGRPLAEPSDALVLAPRTSRSIPNGAAVAGTSKAVALFFE